MQQRTTENGGRAAPASTATLARPLAPKEHGAYAQLGLPLLVALASGRPGPAALLLACAAVAAFFAHEPLLVVLGQRGKRAATKTGGRARLWLTALGSGMVATGVAGLALARMEARIVAIIPAVCAIALVPFIWRREEKTASGELLAATVMAGAALPVAVAAGLEPSRAIPAWVAWVLAFGASTAAVRGTISSAKRRPERSSMVVLVVATALAVAAPLPGYREPLVALPMIVLAWVVYLVKPHPRNLKRIGWALAAASIVTGIALVLVARS